MIHRGESSNDKKARRRILNRYQLFRNGEYQELVTAYERDYAKVTTRWPTHTSSSKPGDLQAELVHRVQAQARNGRSSRAAQMLSSKGVGNFADPAVKQQMRDKHLTERILEFAPAPPREPLPPIDDERMDELKAIFKKDVFKQDDAKGTGPSCLPISFIRALYTLGDSNEEDTSIDPWHQFVQLCMNRIRLKLPPYYYQLTSGATITPLVKKLPDDPTHTPECRPVATGDTFRTLTDRFVVTEHKRAIIDKVAPQQLGVGVRAGVLIQIWGAKLTIEDTRQERGDWIYVKLDQKNAHNSYPRARAQEILDATPGLRQMADLHRACFEPITNNS